MNEKNGLSALSLLIIRSILFKNQLKYFHEYSAFIDNSKENKKKKKKTAHGTLDNFVHSKFSRKNTRTNLN